MSDEYRGADAADAPDAISVRPVTPPKRRSYKDVLIERGIRPGPLCTDDKGKPLYKKD